MRRDSEHWGVPGVLMCCMQCAGDLVVLIKEGVSAITDSILGSLDIPVEEAEEATKAAAA